MSGEDYYVVGARHDFGTHVFTADDIIAFAEKYDPQPFHVDEQRARESLFGGLCASGWHTAAVWMRKNCDYRARDFARIEAEGGKPPVHGPSPGFKNMAWFKPVFAGDTVRFGCTVLAVRALNSKPGWGIVQTENFAETPDGKPVMRFESAVLVQL